MPTVIAMATRHSPVVLFGLLALASPAAAQRADLATVDRSPGDRTTLISSTEWALEAGDSDAPGTFSPHRDEAPFAISLRYAPPRASDSFRAARGEINWDIDDGNVLFGRVESLTPDGLLRDRAARGRSLRVTRLQAGYARNFPLTEELRVTLGGTAATYKKSDVLDAVYGDSPVGYTVFAGLSLGR